VVTLHSAKLSKWGHYIDVMVIILYKLYILSPYTNPTPKPIPITENLLHFYIKKKKKVFYK